MHFTERHSRSQVQVHCHGCGPEPGVSDLCWKVRKPSNKAGLSWSELVSRLFTRSISFDSVLYEGGKSIAQRLVSLQGYFNITQAAEACSRHSVINSF